MAAKNFCESLELSEYQQAAWMFALPTTRHLDYLLPGLVAEVGELNELYAKARRDGLVLDNSKISKELGDILWFIAGLATKLGVTLGEVAWQNLEKLEDRASRNVIGGDGDER